MVGVCGLGVIVGSCDSVCACVCMPGVCVCV